MTCIVGVAHKGKVFIGGDSAGVAGLRICSRADSKVFVNGEFVMGFTSSFRMGQLLRYKLSPPKRHQDDDLMKYMVTEFVDAVRHCLKSGGYAGKTNEVESGGTFLVGVAGRLFSIESDYQVAEHHFDYHAVGCGGELAMGALAATQDTVKDPEKRIALALAAAERHSAGVSAPFVVESA